MAFAGVAYRAQWQRREDFTFGVQQESYDRTYFPRISRARDSRITRSAPTETRRWPSANYTQGLEGGLFRPPPAIDECAVC